MKPTLTPTILQRRLLASHIHGQHARPTRISLNAVAGTFVLERKTKRGGILNKEFVDMKIQVEPGFAEREQPISKRRRGQASDVPLQQGQGPTTRLREMRKIPKPSAVLACT